MSNSNCCTCIIRFNEDERLLTSTELDKLLPGGKVCAMACYDLRETMLSENEAAVIVSLIETSPDDVLITLCEQNGVSADTILEKLYMCE